MVRSNTGRRHHYHSSSFVGYTKLAMEAALTALIIALGFFGEAAFGFGGGLIVIPFLSLVIGVKGAVTVALIFQILMGLALFSSYKNIYWRNAVPILLALIVGSVIGTYFLARVDESVLQILLAVAIFAFLIKSLFFPAVSAPFLKRPIWASGTMAVGGWIQGVMGTAGPVLVMYLSELKLSKEQFRSTLIFLLFVANVVRFPASYTGGLFTSEYVRLAVIALPFFILALILGHFAHKKIEEKYYRHLINIILLISGMALLIKGVF